MSKKERDPCSLESPVRVHYQETQEHLYREFHVAVKQEVTRTLERRQCLHKPTESF